VGAEGPARAAVAASALPHPTLIPASSRLATPPIHIVFIVVVFIVI
jgi:hypothetical protein